MSTKHNGGDSGDGYRDDSSSSSATYDFGPDSRIAIDTDAIYRGAAQFDGAAENVYRFARSSEQFTTYQPLLDSEADETWNRFAPEYFKGAEAYAVGLHALAKATRQISESLAPFAKFCVATEENAEHLARNALNLNGQPGPSVDGQPLEHREGTDEGSGVTPRAYDRNLPDVKPK